MRSSETKVGGKYILGRKLGSGSFGDIFSFVICKGEQGSQMSITRMSRESTM
jgi:hypothetical protein